MLYKDDVDILFEKYRSELGRTKVMGWAEKIKELSTAASISDVRNVKEYLTKLKKYGVLPAGQRESFLEKDARFQMTFGSLSLGPSYKQFAIA